MFRHFGESIYLIHFGQWQSCRKVYLNNPSTTADHSLLIFFFKLKSTTQPVGIIDEKRLWDSMIFNAAEAMSKQHSIFFVTKGQSLIWEKRTVHARANPSVHVRIPFSCFLKICQ